MGNSRPEQESTHDHELVTEEELFQEDAPASFEQLSHSVAPRPSFGSLAPRRLELRAGDVLAGKYRIERVHAPGALGVTCDAEHLQLAQRVSIKLCLADQRSQADRAARFLRGARLAAQFRNPHVARVLDLGTLESGVPYSVTEHLSGTDLRGVLRVREQLPLAEAVDYVLQACEGLAEAHVAGLVHRNLKPSNVFLSRNQDGRPTIKVLDFSLIDGPLGDPSLTLSTESSVVSSLAYVAPEQIREPESVDVRADIWALGALLHELLSGAPLFVASSVPGIFAAIAADTVPPVSHQCSDIPRELDEVLLRCLERERDYRWTDVGALARQLRRFASPAGRDTVDRVIAVLERRARSPRSSLPPALPGQEAKRASLRPGSVLPARDPAPSRRLLEVGLAALAVIGISVGVGAFVTIHHLQAVLAARAAAERPVVASLSPALAAPQTAGTSSASAVPAVAPAALAPAVGPALAPKLPLPPARVATRLQNRPAARAEADRATLAALAEDNAALKKAAPAAPAPAPQTQALFDDVN